MRGKGEGTAVAALAAVAAAKNFATEFFSEKRKLKSLKRSGGTQKRRGSREENELSLSLSLTHSRQHIFSSAFPPQGNTQHRFADPSARRNGLTKAGKGTKTWEVVAERASSAPAQEEC